MLRSCLLLVCLSFCLTLTGCADSPEALMQDTISMMNEMADDIEAGKSQAELEKKYKSAGEDIKKRAEALKPNVTPAQEKELQKKYEAEIKKAASRLMQAAMKKGGTGLKSIPGGGGMF